MPDSTGRRILVVEDEMLIAAELEASLEDAGYAVLGPYPRVGMAIKAIEGRPVDAAVLDVNVNGEMIFPLVETLEARGVPIVFCTGYADLQATLDDLHDHPRISKPASPETLIRIVGELLAGR
jgi:DNA-binding response OmpR family regulator